MAITHQYVEELPDIYRDLLTAFPQFDPTRKAGSGLSYQSLFSALDGKYSLRQIRSACEKMAESDVVEIRNEIFVNPTTTGEELIAAITGSTVPEDEVPPFSPPPSN